MWAGASLRVSRTVTRAADQAPPSVISDVLAAAVPNVGALYAAFDAASFAWSIASWSPSHIRYTPTPISRAAAKKPMPTARQLTFTGAVAAADWIAAAAFETRWSSPAAR